jgi:hypothetical protein
VEEQRGYLDDFWSVADIEIDGDAELQQAVRVATFHVLQAGARAERRAIGAKGLTGPGYDGHTFWDTETFCLQLLSHVAPDAAADALRWRQSILPLARERAAQLGLKGAAFPWRTIRGQECSGYWPAGTAAFHINADIADAVRRHVAATGDVEFEREVGLELLVATARLWRSLGHHDSAGQFRIDGVTGPDEYTAIVDNNVYTNLMAQQNLRVAADTAARHTRAAARLGVNAEEMASWRDAAKSMRIPFDEVLGVHPQSEGFTDHQVWDFAHTPPSMYPLLLHVPYFDLYRKQVIKQADLVLAMQLRPDAFTAEQMARNFAYYEALTVRDSSLSACTQAVSRPGPGTSTWPTTTSPRPPWWTSTTWPATPTTACTSRRWPAPGPRWWPGSAGCATTAAACSSRPGCRRRCPGSPFGLRWQGGCCACRSGRRGRVPAGGRPADAADPPRRGPRAGRRPGHPAAARDAPRRAGGAALRPRPQGAPPGGLSGAAVRLIDGRMRVCARREHRPRP